MIEVFKTNVREPLRANEFTAILQQYFPGSKINFDLEDCDKVLRIEGESISAKKVTTLLKKNNCICEILE